MIFHFLAGRSSLHRLHQTVQRNILRNHQARYESTKSQSPSSRNASTSAPSNTTAPPSAGQQQRTIPGPSWAWIDPFMRPFRAYGRMQKRSPLMVQLESTLVIYFLGDLCSQTVGSNVFIDAQYEPIRGLRAMIIGSISSIPGYKWFLFLGNHFNYSSHLLSLCVKVVVNQTFFTPVFNTYFFGMQTLLSGGSFADAKERVVNTVPVSWKNSWKVWPAVTAFSFTFVPWQHRNVFAGVIAIGWQTYLSWLNRREERREEGVAERKEVGGGRKRRDGQVARREEPVKKEKKRKRKKVEEGEKT